MKLTLKKVKMFQGHDGVGLNADVYVDGVKTLFIFDGATGGESEHSVFDKEKYAELEKYAASLPEYPLYSKEDIERYSCEQVMMKVDIDHLINEELDRLEKEKNEKRTKAAWQKKLNNLQLTAIVFANDEEYSMIRFKIPGTPAYRHIEMMLQTGGGVTAIKKAIASLKEKRPNMKLYNTNIPAVIFQTYERPVDSIDAPKKH